LDEYHISTAILTGQTSLPTEILVQSAFASALAAAYNDWLISRWLGQDDRLRGSICVNANDPLSAAREIERVGSEPRMVQVCLFPTSRGFGEPFFHPIFEVAERLQLVVAIHAGVRSTTPIGFAPHYIEWRTCFPHHIQSQLVSLIAHGVFEKFPRLRVSLVEAGWTWLPSLMWRFDLSYRSLRYEVPWLRRMPSEYIRSNVRLTTQPAETLSSSEFLHLVDVMGSDELLMFSSGYPRWDFDAPPSALPALPGGLAEKIYFGNAAGWYGIS
jgi:predicted TIM-barrel fold metal-dependent hydrolase